MSQQVILGPVLRFTYAFCKFGPYQPFYTFTYWSTCTYIIQGPNHANKCVLTLASIDMKLHTFQDVGYKDRGDYISHRVVTDVIVTGLVNKKLQAVCDSVNLVVF